METVRRLRAHFDHHSVVIAVPPQLDEAYELARLILKALGKSITPARPLHGKAKWREVSIWLPAHETSTVVLLCAQHLTARLIATAQAELLEHGISLVLVFGRKAPLPATTTLEHILAAPIASPSPLEPIEPWPAVPTSHPLRFRYDCEAQLPPGDALLVRIVMNRVWHSLTTWLDTSHTHHDELQQRIAILGYAADPNEAIVRRHAIDVALMGHGLQRPPDAAIAAPLCDQLAVDRALLEADPSTAAFLLAEALTGLPPHLPDLLETEQLLGGKVLGIPVPKRALPIINALKSRYGVQIGLAGWEQLYGRAQRQPRKPHGPGWPPQTSQTTEMLAWLLDTTRSRVIASKLQTSTRQAFDELAEQGILYYDGHTYRITDITSYSTFMTPWLRAPGVLQAI